MSVKTVMFIWVKLNVKVEKCYKNTIRMNIIRKAVRKAIEAEINLNNIDEAIKFVKDELLEDYSEKIVEANMQKNQVWY